MALISGSLRRLQHPIVTIKSSLLGTGMVKSSLLMVREVSRRLESIGLGQLRRINNRRYRCFLLGGGVFSASATKEGVRAEEIVRYDWETNSPKPEQFSRFYKEIDEVHRLTTETLICKQCGLRLRIQGEVEGVTYCTCPDSPKSVFGMSGPDGWSPFLEKKDILIWRRPHSSLTGMYEYKMYGSFNDVTAEEFLFVQNDLSNFRLSWDSSTKCLSSVSENKETNSSVYYWEVIWPTFFSNRDYCCHRTVQTDPITSTTACVSTSTQHPDCKLSKGLVRVGDYNSVLTVRPKESPNIQGLEFCLTGFENPGVTLPESVITWVAMRGMPEFMLNLRVACLRLRREREDCSSRWGVQEDNFGQLRHRRAADYA